MLHQSQISISKEDLTIFVNLHKSKLTKKKVKRIKNLFGLNISVCRMTMDYFQYSLQPTNIYYIHNIPYTL